MKSQPATHTTKTPAARAFLMSLVRFDVPAPAAGLVSEFGSATMALH